MTRWFSLPDFAEATARQHPFKDEVGQFDNFSWRYNFVIDLGVRSLVVILEKLLGN